MSGSGILGRIIAAIRGHGDSIALRFYVTLCAAVVPVLAVALTTQALTRRSAGRSEVALAAAQDVKQLASRSVALLLTQDDATKAMLIEPDNIGDEAQRKIAAYDQSIVVADSMIALSPSPRLRAAIQQLKTLDEQQLRPIDTRMLETLGMGKGAEARRIYLSEYRPVRERYQAGVTKLEALADQEATAAIAGVYAARRREIIAGFAIPAVTVALVGLLVSLVCRGIASRLELTARTLSGIGRGDLSQDLEITSRDEVGRIQEAVNLAVCGMRAALGSNTVRWEDVGQERQDRIERDERLREAVERETRSAADLRSKVDSLLGVVEAAAAGDLTRSVMIKGEDALGRMGDGIERLLDTLRRSLTRIAQSGTTLATSAAELSHLSDELGTTAEETSMQAGVVSAASEQVSRNVQTVATGTEEMTASIREIAKSAADAVRVAHGAVSVAHEATAKVTRLSTSSQAIEQVTKLILNIAQQTNLLALNATIEAARAGEAGKGFAVVANEVKELAKETARATEEIGAKIRAIQTDSSAVVEAIWDMGGVIGQISDLQTIIASAVEEQTATTSEMSRNVIEAAKGSLEIATYITGVARAARETSSGAHSSQEAAQALAEMAADLQALVGQFHYEDGSEQSAPPTQRLKQADNRGVDRRRLAGKRA